MSDIKDQASDIGIHQKSPPLGSNFFASSVKELPLLFRHRMSGQIPLDSNHTEYFIDEKSKISIPRRQWNRERKVCMHSAAFLPRGSQRCPSKVQYQRLSL